MKKHYLKTGSIIIVIALSACASAPEIEMKRNYIESSVQELPRCKNFQAYKLADGSLWLGIPAKQ